MRQEIKPFYFLIFHNYDDKTLIYSYQKRNNSCRGGEANKLHTNKRGFDYPRTGDNRK
jgi:hypothetical protein